MMEGILRQSPRGQILNEGFTRRNCKTSAKESVDPASPRWQIGLTPARCAIGLRGFSRLGDVHPLLLKNVWAFSMARIVVQLESLRQNGGRFSMLVEALMASAACLMVFAAFGVGREALPATSFMAGSCGGWVLRCLVVRDRCRV